MLNRLIEVVALLKKQSEDSQHLNIKREGAIEILELLITEAGKDNGTSENSEPAGTPQE